MIRMTVPLVVTMIRLSIVVTLATLSVVALAAAALAAAVAAIGQQVHQEIQRRRDAHEELR